VRKHKRKAKRKSHLRRKIIHRALIERGRKPETGKLGKKKKPTKAERYNCEDTPAWAKMCPLLTDQCHHVVMRMKCRKTCGSCHEKFNLPEPKDDDTPSYSSSSKPVVAKKSAAAKRPAAAVKPKHESLMESRHVGTENIDDILSLSKENAEYAELFESRDMGEDLGGAKGDEKTRAKKTQQDSSMSRMFKEIKEEERKYDRTMGYTDMTNLD